MAATPYTPRERRCTRSMTRWWPPPSSMRCGTCTSRDSIIRTRAPCTAPMPKISSSSISVTGISANPPMSRKRRAGTSSMVQSMWAYARLCPRIAESGCRTLSGARCVSSRNYGDYRTSNSGGSRALHSRGAPLKARRFCNVKVQRMNIMCPTKIRGGTERRKECELSMQSFEDGAP